MPHTHEQSSTQQQEAMALQRFQWRCMALGFLGVLTVYLLTETKFSAPPSGKNALLVLGILPAVQLVHPTRLVARLLSAASILLAGWLRLVFLAFFGLATGALLSTFLSAKNQYLLVLALATIIIVVVSVAQMDAYALCAYLWIIIPWHRVHPSFVRRFAPRQDG